MEETATATPAAAPAASAPAAPTTSAAATAAVAPVVTTAPGATIMQAGTEQKADGKAPEGGMGGSTMIIIMVVLWGGVLLLMRNNKKREREQREKREKEMNGLNKGDKVVTIGRVHGTVVKADEKTFTIKPDPNRDYTMTFDREALLKIVNREGAEETAQDLAAAQNQQ